VNLKTVSGKSQEFSCGRRAKNMPFFADYLVLADKKIIQEAKR